jgi:DNA repair exonuclease SbcCD ATPase subunit
MTNIKLKDELEKLRAEVKELATDNIEAIAKLETLISELEIKLEEPSDEDHHNNLIANLKETITQFETEHPRATAILNDIMVSLSNMGI